MKRIVSLLTAVVMMAGIAPAALAQGAKDENKGAAGFSWELFARAAASGDQNVVISPVSAYLALLMAAAGAGGDTAAQMQKVLGTGGDFAAACKTLSAALKKTAGSTDVRIANSGWIDDGFTPDPKYLEKISSGMNAEQFVRDLKTDKTRAEINAWVNEKTGGLIPTLLSENLKPETVLALINTLYFKAKWQDTFKANSTFDNTFRLDGGAQVTVPFMNEGEVTREFVSAEGVEGILLPYDDGKTAFLALRPTDGKSVAGFIKTLTADKVASYIASATETYMNLALPKFTLDYTVNMNDILKDMGMISAFDVEKADFHAMGSSPLGNICISRVLQKVRIGVNEDGTEAAAATVVDMMCGSAMPIQKPLNVILDSPFVYAVVNMETGVPLFIGCLDNPEAAK